MSKNFEVTNDFEKDCNQLQKNYALEVKDHGGYIKNIFGGTREMYKHSKELKATNVYFW